MFMGSCFEFVGVCVYMCVCVLYYDSKTLVPKVSCVWELTWEVAF